MLKPAKGEAKLCFSNALELRLEMNVRDYSLEHIQKRKLEMLNWLQSKTCIYAQ